MCDALMFVAGDYMVDQPRRQSLRDLHDFARHVAGRRIKRVVKLGASAARMRYNNDQRCAGEPQRFRLLFDRRRERRDANVADVGSNGC